MKTTFTFCLFFYSHLMVFAAGGFFDSFAYVNVNGSGNTYYDLSATTGNPDFLSANLGTIIQGQSLRLGGQTKTFKNNGTDVTGVAIFYRYYMGSPSGTFTQINYAFQFNLASPGDQQWGTDISGSNPTEWSVNILPGSPAVGTYTLEVYMRVATNGVNESPFLFDSRGGLNYQASFTVEAPLNVSILQFSAIEKASDVHLSVSIDFEKPILDVSFQKMEEGNAKSTWSNIKTFSGYEINSKLNYIDKELTSGEYFYRLAITDRHGVTYYSSIQRVNIRSTSNISIYPNPFRNELLIKGLEDSIESKIVIYDLLGRIVFESIMADGLSKLDVSGIREGMYTFQILDKMGRVLHQQLLMK